MTQTDASDRAPSLDGSPGETAAAPPRYRSLRVPAYVAVAQLTLALVAGAAAFLVEMNHYGVLADLNAGAGVDRGDLDRADELARGADLVRFVVFVGAATAFVVWFSRAYSNLERLGVNGLRYARGWAIGAWFVPILNLFRPKQLANDIWRASDPTMRNEGWHGRDVSQWLHWWWALWIAGGVFGNQAAFAQLQAESVSEKFQASSFALVANILFAVSAAIAIVVVSVVTVRQEARAQAADAQAFAAV